MIGSDKRNKTKTTGFGTIEPHHTPSISNSFYSLPKKEDTISPNQENVIKILNQKVPFGQQINSEISNFKNQLNTI